MQMDIYAQPFKLTAALEQHVVQRVEHAIGTASSSVRGGMVRLLDVNGKRGGVDKTCRIVVWLRHGGSVIVEAVDRDLYAAIDAASVKLRVALGRRLNRRRTLSREYANRRLRLYPPDHHPPLPAWSY
jgi:putative sigma-54 modulation protein